MTMTLGYENIRLSLFVAKGQSFCSHVEDRDKETNTDSQRTAILTFS